MNFIEKLTALTIAATSGLLVSCALHILKESDNWMSTFGFMMAAIGMFMAIVKVIEGNSK